MKKAYKKKASGSSILAEIDPIGLPRLAGIMATCLSDNNLDGITGAISSPDICP
jgi:hypothetical protein